VATGGIAQGALVAQELDLPFVYVRSSSKGHGLQNQVEGVVNEGQKVVVIEDLISTGMSSLNAVQALRSKGCDVLGMSAIFTYGFDKAKANFEKEQCLLYPLCDYHVLIAEAVEGNYISADDVNSLKAWREQPDQWNQP
jgi:orotate phosphoribosyltransferase